MTSNSKFADEYQVIKINSQTYKYCELGDMCFFANDADTDLTGNTMFHSEKNAYFLTAGRKTGEEYLTLDLFFDAWIDIVLTGLFLIYTGYTSTFSSQPEFSLVAYLWIGKNIFWIYSVIRTFRFIKVLQNKVKSNSSTIVFMGSTLTRKYTLSSELFNFLSYCADILVMCYCYQVQEYYFVFECLLCGFIFRMCCKAYFYRNDAFYLIMIVLAIIGHIIVRIRGY